MQKALGPCTPIYENPRKGYSATQLLNLIIGKTSSSKLSTRKPSGVRTFASFIVNLNSVRLKDLYADDNGSWATAAPRRKYTIEMDRDEVVSVNLALDNCSGETVVTLYRQYGTHKGVSAFRRIIATACDAHEKIYDKAVMQYYFVGGKVLPIHVPSHGNDLRSVKPYYRTQPSTLEAIKQECKANSPSVVYHHVLEEAGGAVGSVSVSEEPRNKAQVYNARKLATFANQSKDELFDLLEMLQNNQSSEDGGFLREVIVGSTPSAVLASKQQLENLYTFCCQPRNFTILGIDATFQLGDFYVTLTTYHNLI